MHPNSVQSFVIMAELTNGFSDDIEVADFLDQLNYASRTLLHKDNLEYC
jgi:hypothetical protein